MTIDKQALREAAERAKNSFIPSFRAPTRDVLALLDENIQLQREKDAIEAVALALRDDMRQAREQLEEAEKQIVELSRAASVNSQWKPDVCPVTGRKFFMWIEHETLGYVPTYGGPFDSYTIPTRDSSGEFSCERYDHDIGGWVDGEFIGLYLIDDDEQCRVCGLEERIAELEGNEIREEGNQFLVVRHPGKTPVIKHCSGDLEEFLRNLIEQDPLVTIDIITHRYYGVGGQWVQDADEYLHMMTAAGIGVKKQQDSVDSDVGSRNQPGMVVAVHIDAGDFVKVKGQVFEVEETDFDDHDVTLWFVGGNALKCAAGCQVEVVAAPVDAGIGVKGD
ncbi:ead/Ea22-like family protein [Salmonella enterica subsp. enterica]|nr:ead/Ea22-like family protein [Salmonella enterica subsp. enterica serovar Javiana]MIF19590.1 ead/Ea22-like family protein [Salmonella enterica subsp. enterica serovar Lexington]